MGPEQESKPEEIKGQGPVQSSPLPRRGRHSGRGRRGRGRRSHHQERTVAGEPTQGPPTQAGETPLDSPAPVTKSFVPERSEDPAPPRSERRPASPMAIQEAIEEVTQIIATLRETLDGMEEVLETLELAERQKDADEREIDSLRRAMRPLHRPREGNR